MTIIKAVGAGAELPDLSEAELKEIREQATPADWPTCSGIWRSF